jgi:hypothetical protein
MTIQYRYKLPIRNTYCATQSFGIEPYNVETGRKAGKAIVRLAIYSSVVDSEADAVAVAGKIVALLNAGGTYGGPKTLHFDRNRKNTPQSVEGYF